jgi:UDP-N-acetylmuramoyl-L-alanyl-D-glutamate--2,6-diaminopimelate ligase
MKLSDLLANLPASAAVRLLHPGKSAAKPSTAPLDTRVCDLTEDSRTVVPGSLFIARAGLKADGKKFIESAIQSGAVAILTDDAKLPAQSVPVLHAADVPLATALFSERFFGSPSQRLKVLLVTGTNASDIRCGLMGTVLIDDGREVAPASMTTPPSTEVSQSLASMVEAGCKAVTLEASSHALDQKRLDALKIDVGIFTNLTGDHLDYHKTMDQYAAAKARLFEMLPPDGVAIVNADDAASTRMIRDCRAPVTRCRVIEAGAKTKTDPEVALAEIVTESMSGMSLRLSGAWGLIETTVPLIGRYNAMNILQAVVACHAMGLAESELKTVLPRIAAPPGRLERVSELGAPVSVFVDYAHSDDSLVSVLRAVSEVMPNRNHAAARLHKTAGAPARPGTPANLWVVFGCGGDKDRTKRPRMGKAAAEGADRLVITSDNPRTERPSAIIDEIITGIAPAHKSKMTVQVDRERAIRHAIENAQPGDVVVIAGKGHETEQILSDGQGGTVKIHFDDREVARAILEELHPAPKKAPSPNRREHARGRTAARR